MTDQEITQLALLSQQMASMQADIILLKGVVEKGFERAHNRIDANAQWILRMQGVVTILILLVVPVVIAVIIRWLATVQ